MPFGALFGSNPVMGAGVGKLLGQVGGAAGTAQPGQGAAPQMPNAGAALGAGGKVAGLKGGFNGLAQLAGKFPGMTPPIAPTGSESEGAAQPTVAAAQGPLMQGGPAMQQGPQFQGGRNFQARRPFGGGRSFGSRGFRR